ncbi:rod shape-determining protein MreD [Jatrophihabitans sp. DSM 45814]
MTRLISAVATVLTALLLQATLVGPLTFPVPVSLPVLLVVVVAIYAGPGVGLGLGFCTGLLADLGSAHPAGVQALCWMGAGVAAGVLGGLAVERGYRTRAVAAMAALIAGFAGLAVGLVLAVLGSHDASFGLAVRLFVPVVLTDALLGLAVVPAVRAMLRAQGIRADRPTAELVGRYVAN